MNVRRHFDEAFTLIYEFVWKYAIQTCLVWSDNGVLDT